MSFTELPFLGVLLLALIALALPVSFSGRKVALLALSYFFYAAFHPVFVLLLLLSTLVDALCAKGIHRAHHAPKKKRAFLALSLISNLGVLVLFKYAAFILSNMQALGVFKSLTPPSWTLPLGISFYTFQTLSYTLDVYKQKRAPADSFLDFALYVSFFPQLVAGPIVRAGNMLEQLKNDTRPPLSLRLERGLTLLVLGYFQKHALADGWLAPIAESVFDADQGAGFIDAWCGLLAFSGQILFDFAGYSTMALGAAAMLGISLPLNFRFPYAARGFSDFWRRWHITLSEWLRDYLYIPLGGSRHGPLRTFVALMLTMLLGGLWHGTSWNFVIWGALHGLFLVVERFCKNAITIKVPGIFIYATTLLGVLLAWVFFRAATWPKATAMLSALFAMTRADQALLSPGERAIALTFFLGILAVHAFMRERNTEGVLQKLSPPLRGVLLAALLLLALTTGGVDRAFLYFQF